MVLALGTAAFHCVLLPPLAEMVPEKVALPVAREMRKDSRINAPASLKLHKVKSEPESDPDSVPAFPNVQRFAPDA
jgi:hypothetical protein